MANINLHMDRLKDLAQLQKQRNLTDRELMEVAECYRALGNARRAEQAAFLAERLRRPAPQPKVWPVWLTWAASVVTSFVLVNGLAPYVL